MEKTDKRMDKAAVWLSIIATVLYAGGCVARRSELANIDSNLVAIGLYGLSICTWIAKWTRDAIKKTKDS